MQNEFHVHCRHDVDVLTQCEWEGIAYAPYFPLGGGRGPIDANRLADAAARHRATTVQVALAWLLAVAPATLAIPGTGSLDHPAENAAATGLRLTASDLAQLGALERGGRD